MINFYQILEIERTASQNEIKSAFRKLSFRYHPDLNNHPEAEEMFKRVNEAYQVLSDSVLRKIYDEKYYELSKKAEAAEYYRRTKFNLYKASKKASRAYRNVLFIFLFFITLFLIFEVTPSLSTVNSINEYKANLSQRAFEYYKTSPERDAQIALIIKRVNVMTDMFRNLPQKPH